MLAILAFFAYAWPSFATNNPPQTFTLDGQLLQTSNDQPLLDSSAKIEIQILDPSKTCLLYDERQTVSTISSNGYYTIQVGSNVGDAKRTASDPSQTMAQVFQNSTAITAGNAPGQTCTGGTYTPVAGASRYIRLIVTPSSTGIADTLSPDTIMDSVPSAIVAETVQGLSPSNLLQVNTTAPADLSQANLENVFSTTNYPRLTSLLSGTSSQYIPASPTSSVSFNSQLLTNVADPTSAQDAATKHYADNYIGGLGTNITGLGVGLGDGEVLTWDGTTGKWIAQAASTPADLPLAGGTMSGAINMNTNDITNAGYITMTSDRYLQLSNLSTTQETTLSGTLGAGNSGATWYNATDNDVKVWNGSAAHALIQNGGQPGAIAAGPSDANALTLETNGSARMTIDSSGNVGVGTTSPSSALSVFSSSAAGAGVMIQNSNSSVGNPTQVGYGGKNDTGGEFLLGIMGSGANYGPLQTGDTYLLSGGDMIFWSNNSTQAIRFSTGTAEAMRIQDSNGYVGIGTTSPGTILDVNGAFSMRGMATPAVSPSGQGRIYFDSTANEFEMSQNGSTYAPLATTSTSSFSNVSSISNSSGSITLAPAVSTGSVDINSGTASTGSTSGALVVTGGIGASGDIYTGASINAGSTMSATTSLTTPQIYGSNLASGTLRLDGTSNATRGAVLINSTGGNVGIGTTSPAVTLDIQGSSSRVWNGGLGTSISTHPVAGNGYMYSQIGLNTYFDGANWITGADGVNNGAALIGLGYQGDLQFMMFGDSGGSPRTFSDANLLSHTKFIIKASGNVGIGTSLPSGILDVEGGTAAAGNGVNIKLVAQTSFQSGNTNGGNILLTPGSGHGTGLNGQVILGNGSVNAPGLAFAGSTGTGLYMDGSGNLWQIVGGSTVAEWNSQGLSFNPGAPGAFLTGNSTAGAPSYTFGDNQNLGMFEASSGVLAFSTGGNERVRISSSGDVGIGTTSPSSNLSFTGQSAQTIGMERESTAGAAGNNLTLFAGGAASGATNANGGDIYIKSGTATGTGRSHIYFQVPGFGSSGTSDNTPNTVMFLNWDGLQIGSTNATTLGAFQVTGDGTGPMGGLTQQDGGANGAWWVLSSNRGGGQSTAGDEVGQLQFQITDTGWNGSNVAAIRSVAPSVTAGAYSGTLEFQTAVSGTLADRIMVDQNGNVGIGTTSPGSALDVKGALSVDGMAAPAVSPSGQGRIYFDSTANKFEVSENGGAYAPLATGTGSYLPLSGGTMTGPILQANGSASNPSYSFSGSSSTGIYSEGSNYLDVGASGSRVALFSSSGVTVWGQIGSHYGTATAYVPNGTTAAPANSNLTMMNDGQGDGSYNGINMYSRNSGATYQASYITSISNTSGFTPDIAIGQQTGVSSYAERLRINSSGYVGIGTTSPSDLLNVNNGSVSLTGTQGPNGGMYVNTQLPAGASESSIRLSPWLGSSAVTTAIGVFVNSPTINTGSMANYYAYATGVNTFATGTTAGYESDVAAGSGRYNLYLDGTAQNYLAGNVGIGTTTPAGNLDVENGSDTAKICLNGVCSTSLGSGSSQWTTSGSNIYYNTGSVGIGTTGPNREFSIANSTQPTQEFLETGAGTDDKGWLEFATGGTLYFQLINDAENHGATWMQVQRTGTTVNSVDLFGNVGIGTTTPNNTLDVNGGITVTSCTGCSVIAEMMPIDGSIEEGDAVCMSPETGKIAKCTEDGSLNVFGITTEHAEQILRQGCADSSSTENSLDIGGKDHNFWKTKKACQGWFPVALTGVHEFVKTECYRDDETPMRYGDRLVTAGDHPGYLRPLNPREQGGDAVVGRAMTICSPNEALGTIHVRIK